jgi:hypothetical protein
MIQIIKFEKINGYFIHFLINLNLNIFPIQNPRFNLVYLIKNLYLTLFLLVKNC